MKQIITLIIVIGVAVLAGQLTVNQTGVGLFKQQSSNGEYHRVIKVYDGDTVKLDNGLHVRLIGIDTPESHDNLKMGRDVKKLKKSKKILLKMGQQAAAYTTQLLEGQQVRLVFDVEPHDRYERTLAYLYLPDGTFVNEKIIREGYAYPLTVPPNVKYAHLFQQWFEEAREAKRGLWGE